MLLLSNPRTITVDGITVFPDHADVDQFWYLPAPVALMRRGPDQDAQFTLIVYKPAAVSSGVKGGGFLMFEAGIQVDAATERKILSRLSSLSRRPRLAAVQFDEGTVQCIALNLQGGGGTTPGGDGGTKDTFNAVESILGAKTPSLHGANSAAFSLRLSQEGAIILREAFKKEGAPVGVLYTLKFTGVQPAMEVTITADMKRVYEHFSAGLSATVYYVQVGVEVGLEKLKEDKAIDIKVSLRPTPIAERAPGLRYSGHDRFLPARADSGRLMGGGTPPPTGGGGRGGGRQAASGVVCNRAAAVAPPGGGGGVQPGGGAAVCSRGGGGGVQPGGGGGGATGQQWWRATGRRRRWRATGRWWRWRCVPGGVWPGGGPPHSAVTNDRRERAILGGGGTLLWRGRRGSQWGGGGGKGAAEEVLRAVAAQPGGGGGNARCGGSPISVSFAEFIKQRAQDGFVELQNAAGRTALLQPQDSSA